MEQLLALAAVVLTRGVGGGNTRRRRLKASLAEK